MNNPEIRKLLRDFNYAMAQVGRCYDLQAERVRMGWLDYAMFYQAQAAIWYERAVECRAHYNEAIAALIPGTSVRWDEVFFIWTWPDLSRSISLPLSWNEIYDIVDPFSKPIDLIPHIGSTRQQGKIEIKPRDHGMTRRWETMPDPRLREHHYASPKERYDNPRDVPLTLQEVSDQLKRWLS